MIATQNDVRESSSLAVKFIAFCEKEPSIGFRIVLTISRIISSRLRKTNEDVLKLTTALSLALSK